MTQFQLLIVFTFAVLISTHSEREREQIFLARGFQESGGVKTFFRSRTASELNELRHHSSIKVSINAAWIDCWTNCLGVDDPGLHKHEFLGFVSGRLRTGLPKWWKTHFLGIRFAGDFPYPQEIQADDFVNYTTTDGVQHSSSFKLHLEANKVLIDLQGERLQVVKMGKGWSYEDDFKGENPRFFAFATTADNRIVFATANGMLDSFSVYCASSSGEKLWQSEVSRFRQSAVGGGVVSERQLMEICVDQEKAVVFWQNAFELSMDIFNIDTGEPLARFTTFVEGPIPFN